MDWRRKLTSRKFWVCICNFVGMLLTAAKLPDSQVTQITAIIMAGAGVVAYILAEGWADAANAEPYILDEPEEEDDE